MSNPTKEVLQRFEDGEILAIAEFVCPRERPAAEVFDAAHMEWDTRQFDHFEVDLALDDVTFEGRLDDDSFQVHEARFHIFGPKERMVKVNRANEDFVREDPFSIEVVEKFVEVYADHMHIFCLSALRARRLEVLQARQRAENTYPITVTDKRRVR
jgi:hypothetical protein